MCLRPLKIVNPSRWIDPSGFQKLFIDVPCGQCSECIVTYRNEWRNRAYYEALGCFAKSDNSYILMDTLTYRNGCLPHLSDIFNVPYDCDFPCFCKVDVQEFFVRLRRYLSSHGYDVEHNLRYFVASEYGSDLRKTRRPHYHVLFFVSCDLPVDVLSKAISKEWKYGRTDGVPYKPLKYVENHCVFRSMLLAGRNVVSYVTKYCTKDLYYNRLVRSRLSKIRGLSFYEDAKKFVRPFHLQSKGFGHDYLIESYGRNELIDIGRFKILDSKGYAIYVSLHKSLQRKLLYDYKRVDGRVVWSLNNDGFKYKKDHFQDQIDFALSKSVGLNVEIDDLKQSVYNKVYFDGRFNRSVDVSEIIDGSYNVNKGLRNYSCHDRSFFHKSVFTAVDFGQDSRGFCHDCFHRRSSLVGFGALDYISLSDLSKYVVNEDTVIIDSYNQSRLCNGDSQIEVMKLINHLKFIHSKHYV